MQNFKSPAAKTTELISESGQVQCLVLREEEGSHADLQALLVTSDNVSYVRFDVRFSLGNTRIWVLALFRRTFPCLVSWLTRLVAVVSSWVLPHTVHLLPVDGPQCIGIVGCWILAGGILSRRRIELWWHDISRRCC